MTVYEWIILSIILIIVVPIISFLAMKSGTVGFYRGKEVGSNRDNSIDNNEEEETENQ